MQWRANSTHFWISSHSICNLLSFLTRKIHTDPEHIKVHLCITSLRILGKEKSNILALHVNIWTMNYLLISLKVRRSVCVTYSKWTLEIAPWPKKPIKTILSNPFILLQSLRSCPHQPCFESHQFLFSSDENRILL